MLRFVTIGKFSAESGYTEGAVRAKIDRGDWLEGEVYVRAPDGRILIDTEGFVPIPPTAKNLRAWAARREVIGRKWPRDASITPAGSRGRSATRAAREPVILSRRS